MNSQFTPPPPPPINRFCSNYLACSLLLGAQYFSIPAIHPKLQPPIYTTTVSGRIV